MILIELKEREKKYHLHNTHILREVYIMTSKGNHMQANNPFDAILYIFKKHACQGMRIDTLTTHLQSEYGWELLKVVAAIDSFVALTNNRCVWGYLYLDDAPWARNPESDRSEFYRCVALELLNGVNHANNIINSEIIQGLLYHGMLVHDPDNNCYRTTYVADELLSETWFDLECIHQYTRDQLNDWFPVLKVPHWLFVE